ncbi:acyl dehydratase [Mycobacteroides chelonae]|nr:acyl dehydratase [Mycobacteroides chelonae]
MIDPLVVDIDTSTIIAAATASRDWTAFHHDPVAARAAGMRDIILNTPAHMAFVSRWLTSSVAESGRIRRLTLQLRSSVYPGDRMTISGRTLPGTHATAVSFESSVQGKTLARGTGVVQSCDRCDPWAIPLEQWALSDDPGVPLRESD